MLEKAPALGADVVMLDPRGIPFGGDLARNDPDLTNRPLVLDYTKLTPGQVAELCRRHTVAAFDWRDWQRLNPVEERWPIQEPEDLRAPLRVLLAQEPCRAAYPDRRGP